MNDFPLNLPFVKGVEILKVSHEHAILALYKPPAIKSHPNAANTIDPKSLIKERYSLKLEAYLTSPKLYLLHRLDSPTSGLILLSWDLETAQIIKSAFKSKSVKKTYHALLKGKVKSGTWSDYLITQKIKGQLRTQQGRGRPAETVVQRVHYSKEHDLSLVQFTPKTGLTHQLRVQSALRHHPILGDKTYGDFDFNKRFRKVLNINRLCLHASSLQLVIGGSSLKFKSPIPNFMEIKDL